MEQKTVLPVSVFLGLCAIPLLAMYFPRSLAFLPSAIGISAGLWMVFVYKQKIQFSKPYFFWALGIGLLWAASCFWSVDFSGSLEKIFQSFPVILLGVALFSYCQVMPIEKIKPYLWVFPLCLAIAACVITFDLFFKLPIYRWTRGLGARDLLSSAVMNRSIVTITLSLFAGMFFLSYWEGGKKWKFILSGFLIFSVLPLLILTQSQSAQLSVLVGLFFFLFFPYKFKTAYTGLIGILTLTMVLAPWIAYWMWESLTFNSVFHEWFKNAYASNRMEIWDFVSRRALESPFYGHGLEATKLIGNFDHIPIFQKSSSILHPHNYALQLWIEFGLLGVVSCLFFLGYLFSFIQQRTTLLSGRVCMATLMAVLAVSAVGYGMWQSWWLGLLIYLLSLCALIVRFEQKTAKNSTYAP